jgi:hypothetical protein
VAARGVGSADPPFLQEYRLLDPSGEEAVYKGFEQRPDAAASAAARIICSPDLNPAKYCWFWRGDASGRLYAGAMAMAAE